MKILFAIKAFDDTRGGAERVLADVASGLAQYGHDVSIISFDKLGNTSFYPLDPAIKRIYLGIGKIDSPSTLLETIARMLSLRKTIKLEQPDIVIGFMHSMFVPLAFSLIGTQIPIIASEHIVLEHYKAKRFEFILILIISFFVKKFTVLSEDIKKCYPTFLHKKMFAIANPVRGAKQLSNTIDTKCATKTILNIGRLSTQKDQEILIKSFAKISSKYPDWQVKIFGDGELRPLLENLVIKLGMEDRISLPGTTKEIDKEYQKAHIFALPSRYESFGLATAEAMAHGLPVIGFADCPGTNELIEDGANGLLVYGDDRVITFANALEKLIISKDLRYSFGQKGIITVEKFAPKKIVGIWEEFIRDTVKCHKK